MNILLHSCCAPCTTEVFNRLSKDHDITGFFYNPNIQPKKEYGLRNIEFERFSDNAGFPHISCGYDMREWFKRTRGLEKEAEGGKRCEICFRMRLEETAKTAVKYGFEAFTTTLSVSPHKNASLINKIGREVGKECGVHFIVANFKKNNGFKRSVEISKRLGLHRQNYCGCVYSRLERRIQTGLVR